MPPIHEVTIKAGDVFMTSTLLKEVDGHKTYDTRKFKCIKIVSFGEYNNIVVEEVE